MVGLIKCHFSKCQQTSERYEKTRNKLAEENNISKIILSVKTSISKVLMVIILILIVFDILQHQMQFEIKLVEHFFRKLRLFKKCVDYDSDLKNIKIRK